MSKEITPLTSVFFELISRKCFTDYLDDVSTVYYDNASLAAINGEESAELADPNTSEFKTHREPNEEILKRMIPILPLLLDTKKL